MKYADFEFGNNTLKFWDDSKVELKEFKPEGQDRVIRFFRKKGFDAWDKAGKIISRSGLASLREPFSIEAWNQIMIDDANEYGTLVDKNKEAALRGEISNEDVLIETKLSVAKLANENLIWVARGQMVCHPESIIYGEIDEIWYDKVTDTYIVGDTKTSSSVDKIGYWYQLSIYVEILRALNPDKKISSIAMIDWVKIKKTKWAVKPDFNESMWIEFKDKQVTKDDEVYNAKWHKVEIEPETTNKLISKDIEKTGVLELAKDDIDMLLKFNVSSVDDLNEKINSDFDGMKQVNINLQTRYDSLKSTIGK